MELGPGTLIAIEGMVELGMTPTHGGHIELDFGVPVFQGEELHRALARRRVPTLFVHFLDEGHGLSRSGQPLHRLERLQWIVAWFEKYLSGS
jgi:dipeptidyl aminopeptidase/acylaminoacyl peptidase